MPPEFLSAIYMTASVDPLGCSLGKLASTVWPTACCAHSASTNHGSPTSAGIFLNAVLKEIPAAERPMLHTSLARVAGDRVTVANLLAS
jgi:hypothetical protein